MKSGKKDIELTGKERRKLLKLYLELRDEAPKCMDEDVWVGMCATWELLSKMGDILDKYEKEKI